MSMLWFSSFRKRVCHFVGICNARDFHEDRKRDLIGSLL